MSDKSDPVVEGFRNGTVKPCSYCWGGSKEIVAGLPGVAKVCPVCKGTRVEPKSVPNESEGDNGT